MPASDECTLFNVCDANCIDIHRRSAAVHFSIEKTPVMLLPAEGERASVCGTANAGVYTIRSQAGLRVIHCRTEPSTTTSYQCCIVSWKARPARLPGLPRQPHFAVGASLQWTRSALGVAALWPGLLAAVKAGPAVHAGILAGRDLVGPAFAAVCPVCNDCVQIRSCLRGECVCVRGQAASKMKG